MKALYDIGELVWYYCAYEETGGLGIIIDYIEHADFVKYKKTERYASHYLEYVVLDLNTPISCGGFEEDYSRICCLANQLACVEYYSDFEDFKKSRG